MQLQKATRKKALLNSDEWQPLSGHAGYEVHFRGYVRNSITKLILKAGKGGGYLTVALNGKTQSIHRLVATQFIPNPLDKKCVNHIDGNKLNNHVENLEWATHSENNSHAIRTGLKDSINKPRGVIQYDLNWNEIARYRTSEDVPGIRSGNVCRACNDPKKTAGGYRFKFIN
jgi:HNH endonuclease